MDRRFKWTVLSLAMVATLAFCQFSSAQYAVGTNSTGGCSESGTLGYPTSSGDCGGACYDQGGRGGQIGNGNFKAYYAHLCEINKRAYDRNRAWPKPFDCADRQLYFSMWNNMLEDGYRCNCVFTETHFDGATNQLNEAGKSKIRGIFKNNPIGQKVALVQNSAPGNIVDARLENLQSTIDQWYGTDSFAEVALTEKYPTGFAASRVEAINQLSNTETPAPVIPVATGTGSTSDVGID